MSRASSHPLNDLRSLSVDMAVTSETRLTIFCGYEMFSFSVSAGRLRWFYSSNFPENSEFEDKVDLLGSPRC